MMKYMLIRQTVICKALALLKVITKNGKSDYLTKEEFDALPDIIEKEHIKLNMLESEEL